MSTIYTEPRQCPATIAIRDDRWGAVNASNRAATWRTSAASSG